MNNFCYKDYLKNTIAPSLLFSALVGVVTGIVVYFFKFGVYQLFHITEYLYALVRSNLVFLPLFFLGLVVLALLMERVLKIAPEAKGGGIARSTGILRGLITFKWLRLLIGSLFASAIGFFAGLPLGTEGPCVQIGTALGAGSHEITSKKKPAWRRYFMTGSASAGFAVATNAPLAGIVFVLEEVHKRFSPILLMVAFTSVLFASATSQLLSSIIGTSVYMFELGDIPTLPLNNIWVPLIMGIIIGLLSCVFNLSKLYTSKMYDEKLHKLPLYIKLIVVFLLVGTAGLFFGDVLSGGHDLIVKIENADFVWQILLVLLAIKFVLVIISSSSGATGGLFIPLLAIGALIGGLLAKLFMIMGMNEAYYKTVVTLSMCAFLGSSLRAPITAMVFIVEATGSFNNFLFTGIAVFAAFMIAEVLNIEPLNDVILTDIMDKQTAGKEYEILKLKMKVQKGAFIAGLSARDILWPANSIIRHLVRAKRPDCEMKMLRSGDRKLFVGDTLHIQAQTYDKQKTIEELEALVGKQNSNVIE